MVDRQGRGVPRGEGAEHKSIIGALKAAAPKWEFEQINFVMGNRGSVVESDFLSQASGWRERHLGATKRRGLLKVISLL